MSTTSVWDIELGGAVMGVTHPRDGFRNNSDERSKGAVVVCLTRLQMVSWELRTIATVADEFRSAKPRNVAIFSYSATRSGPQ